MGRIGSMTTTDEDESRSQNPQGKIGKTKTQSHSRLLDVCSNLTQHIWSTNMSWKGKTRLPPTRPCLKNLVVLATN
jgi:hypothetical protein